MPEGRRPERVSELVLRELSNLLVRELKDPRLRGVTLTHVHMDDDLRHGRVYFSHLAGQEHVAAVKAGFKSASGFIRREIGRVLSLRYIPNLDFEYDEGIEHSAKIGALLRDIREKE